MKSELKSIKKASFAKRIVANIMDGAVTLFIFFALFLFVFTPIANKAFGFKDAINEGTQMQEQCGLYIIESEEASTYILITKSSNEDVNFYKENLKHYYCDFKVNSAPDKDINIKDNEGNEIAPKDYYTEEWFNNKMSEVVDVATAKKACQEALNDFGQYLKPINKKVYWSKMFIALCSYAVSFGVFYILVPLLFKNGETFGKKTMGLALVNKEGYDIKKRQIVLRQLFLFFYVALFSFYVGIGFTSFAFLGIGVLIYFVAAFISKTNRSMADYLSYTYLIDGKNSVWFKDKKEEEEKEAIVESNLEKYNKTEELNKNIIQVGSEIVNEEIKEEFLESKEGKKDENS